MYSAIRTTLELLYFLATIALAAIAFKALEQIKVARDVAQKSAKREAYKLAHDQCRVFASEVVPKFDTAIRGFRAAGVKLFDAPWNFTVKEGEFVSPNFPRDAVIKAAQAFQGHLDVMNSMEAFAMFFMSGAADDEIGYRETAIGFCQQVRMVIPMFWLYREMRMAKYRSVVELYELWNDRLQIEELQARKQEIDAGLQNVKARRVPAIGTE